MRKPPKPTPLLNLARRYHSTRWALTGCFSIIEGFAARYGLADEFDIARLKGKMFRNLKWNYEHAKKALRL